MLIILDKVNYVYSEGSGFEKKALDDVSLTIDKGEFIGLIGHTGSGKSTLTQHLNGLLRATSGNIYYDGQDIYEKGFVMKNLRSKVGLVFQYPEHQLFESDVFTDVCFGPKNLGLDKKDVELRAFEALEMVGFPKELFYNSPFELSGGQKRRAAIAGVLAMKPEVLILDEPTAMLDPKGRSEVIKTIKMLNEEKDITVVLITHYMDEAAQADRTVVIDDGEIVLDGTPKEVFKNVEKLKSLGLDVPQVTELAYELRKMGIEISDDVLTVDECFDEIIRILGETKR